MKKTLGCLCLFVQVVVIGYALELENTLWGTENGEFGFYIKFKKNNAFEFAYAGEGGGQNVLGTYTQNEKDIILKTETINEWGDLPDYIKQKTVLLSIREVNDSIFSLYKLVGKNGVELWSRSYTPKEGTQINWNGNKVTITSIMTKKVVANARFRIGPGLKYTYQTFSFEDSWENVRQMQSVPADTTVEIFAYSSDKDSIEGEENYWYYCRFSNIEYSRIYGWIWGELLQ